MSQKGILSRVLSFLTNPQGYVLVKHPNKKFWYLKFPETQNFITWENHYTASFKKDHFQRILAINRRGARIFFWLERLFLVQSICSILGSEYEFTFYKFNK